MTEQYSQPPKPPPVSEDPFAVLTRELNRKGTYTRNRKNSDSLLTVFDFSFQSYCAPVVIKILWVVFVFLWATVDLIFIAIAVLTEHQEPIINLVPLAFLVPLFLIYKVLTLLLGRLLFEFALVIFDIRDSLHLIAKNARR